MTNTKTFVHPGMLHTQKDFTRIKKYIAENNPVINSGLQRLTDNPHASLTWHPNPAAVIYRGKNSEGAENYAQLYRDAAAAYATALRWHISGDKAYADKSIEILNAWGTTLTAIRGSTDAALAAGIYGYQLANAAELMRDYPGWKPDAFAQFKTMMMKVFYPINHDFLVRHNNAKIDHYWANWDLAQMCSILAIGILTDSVSLYDEAIDYFKNGAGNGNITRLVWVLYPEKNMGQIQESGRDQGHATLDIALVATFCQMAFSQGDDLFAWDDNRVMKGAEYVAAYNLGHDVPYTPYTNSDVTQKTISDTGRGHERPTWELLYNHYVVGKKLQAPNIQAFAERLRPEGGGGDGDSTSGGYDQLGYGTLLFTL